MSLAFHSWILLITGCGSGNGERLDVVQTNARGTPGSLDTDPAVAESAYGSCAVDWGERHAFQCPVDSIANGEPIAIDLQWEVHHPTPGLEIADGRTECEDHWMSGETYPLVLVAHGGGELHTHTKYSYLLEHLALNDFIAMSVSTWAEPEKLNTLLPSQRADMLEAMLECLQSERAANFIGPHWDRRLALVGHSRGGEAQCGSLTGCQRTKPSTFRRW